MDAFRALTRRQARWLAIHDGARDRLRGAAIERQRGAAKILIASQALAALRRSGPRAAAFTARYLRQQADGMEREQRFAARAAFLLRQVRRTADKLREGA